jgi:hypothetical protein
MLMLTGRIVTGPGSESQISRPKPRSRTGHPGLNLTAVVCGPHNTPHPGAVGAEAFTIELTVLNVLNGRFNLADAATRVYVLGKLLSVIYLTARRAVRKALVEDLMTLPRVPFIEGQPEGGMTAGPRGSALAGSQRGDETVDIAVQQTA